MSPPTTATTQSEIANRDRTCPDRAARYSPLMQRHSLRAVPDDELLARLAELLRQSRRTESDLVAHVAEVDERRLYAREACPSMFAYCTEVLHLSEAEAYLRIAAARASREHPLLLDMLADGRLHLSGVGKLAPHLTRENAPVLLARSAHKTKRQIEELIAELTPRPDAPNVMRKLPERAATANPAPGADPIPDPAAAERHVARPGLTADIELRPDAVGLRAATEHASSPAPLGPPRSNPWERPATGSSSRPRPRSATSWNGSER
jgi:hypothetical protein